MQYLIHLLKGLAMGAANVIPGVSGGTIALITGIFERLINSVKSFDLKSLNLLIKGQFKTFAQKTDLFFLLSIFLGIALAIVSLARIFDYLFENYPSYIWAYFFGLVLASVYFVGKTVKKWQLPVYINFLLGTVFAIILVNLNPAVENDGFLYLVLCGVVAICSMILPGLSGSFVLILMGNYQLVAIDAINNRDITVLLPVAVGAVGGLIAFSHLLSWVFKKYHDQTIALLTGFILGSLGVLWPWKSTQWLTDENGVLILKENGEKVVAGYTNLLPQTFSNEVAFALGFVILGILSIWFTEWLAARKN